MNLRETDSKIAELIDQESRRQETTLELIASENHVSKAVMEAAGSCLTNKYAEGYPGVRYYGGCGFYDQIENLAIDRAKQLFNCKFANVVALSEEKIVAQLDCQDSTDGDRALLNKIAKVDGVVQTNIIAVVRPVKH